MSDRTPVYMLDPVGAPDGTYSVTVTGGVVSLTEPATDGGGGGGELLVADGITPPENLTTEAGDDWLYQG